jgi:hypothetical protein
MRLEKGSPTGSGAKTFHVVVAAVKSLQVIRIDQCIPGIQLYDKLII